MSGPNRRFDPSELRTPGETEPSVAESAGALAAARELEALAASDLVRPSEGFEDRIMAAIATAPAPRVVVRPGSTIRGGRPASFLLAIRDAWAVASSGGRPMAVRAQAIAFVLLVFVAAGSLAAAGAVTVGGMLNGSSSPTPTLEVGPTAAPTQTGPAAPTANPTPTTVAEPTETVGPGETAEPTGTPEPGATAEPAQTAKPGETPRATRTPTPTETPEPGETPEPTETDGGDDDGGGGGHGPG
jgi:hypothetical protein